MELILQLSDALQNYVVSEFGAKYGSYIEYLLGIFAKFASIKVSSLHVCQQFAHTISA